MDGRDPMAMSGASSYYIQHTSIGGGPGSVSQVELHGPPGMRRMHNPSPSMPLQSSHVGSRSVGSALQVEPPSSISSHGVVNAGGAAAMTQGEPVKRKRGRPRKYRPDGTISLALSPLSSTTPGSGSGSTSKAGSVSGSGSVTPMQKQGRGRPPGTGRKQQLASLGEWFAGSAGTGFTPHIITIGVGEDIASKIMSLSQQGPRAVCILSANGAVSTVTLRQSETSGGTVTYEGRFEILCLSGLYLLNNEGGSRSRTGGLSVSLSSPDGRVIGGGVGGLLIAASPVQVVVGSFIYGGTKTKQTPSVGQELGSESEPMSNRPGSLSSSGANQNLSPSSIMDGWPASKQMDMRHSHLDIDLTRG